MKVQNFEVWSKIIPIIITQNSYLELSYIMLINWFIKILKNNLFYKHFKIVYELDFIMICLMFIVYAPMHMTINYYYYLGFTGKTLKKWAVPILILV